LEVRLPGVLGSLGARLRRQSAIGVHLALEAVEEGRPARFGSGGSVSGS
jgi:hypothetical protein